MARFQGAVESMRSELTTRLGGKSMRVWAASWAGKIEVRLYVGNNGEERYEVSHESHHGKGDSFPIACGIIGQKPSGGVGP